jgi:hypothetical protein
MNFANFTNLPQELRDQIWAEAASIQCQQVRGNLPTRNGLLLLTLNWFINCCIVSTIFVIEHLLF